MILYSLYAALWTNHPVTTWIFLEIILMSVLPFLSAAAGVRYFAVQGVSSVLFFSAALITSDMFIIWIGMGLKIGAAPIHWWVPLIYQESSWLAIFILRTVIKVVPLAILDIGESSLIISGVLVANAIVGAVGGLYQTSLKMLLAYSSIAHLGWIFGALIVSTHIWSIYLLVYRVNMGILLLINKIKDISVYFILLVLGGLPPFLGFYPKLYIMKAMSNSQVGLIFCLLGSSILTLLYYVRILVVNLLRSQRWGKNKILLLLTSIGSTGLIPLLNRHWSFTVIAYLCSRLRLSRWAHAPEMSALHHNSV